MRSRAASRRQATGGRRPSAQATRARRPAPDAGTRTTARTGRVVLIGAGPGSRELLTLRGAECLSQADVVLYDRLVPVSLLASAPSAECVPVGPMSHGGTGRRASQRAVIQRMIREAGKGRFVVRLKGGDPFIFGRGGEEAAALAKAGVPFEVLSGVTAAVAAPAAAGIPLTDRRYASSVAIVTGHEEGARRASRIRWKQVATGCDTLVFLMALKQLPNIVRRLRAGGRAASTPAAVVRAATWPDEEVVVGTLRTIERLTAAAALQPPAVLVVGHVVRLREALRPRETRPLHGMRVAVTRADTQAGALSSLLTRRGAVPVEIPLIRFVPPTSYGALDAAIRHMGRYHWVLFTSVNGVRAFRERLRRLKKDVRVLAGCRVCAIGPKTTAELDAAGIAVDVQPRAYTSEAVARTLRRFPLRGRRVLLVRAQEAPQTLPVALREAGARVDVAPAYRTVPVTPGPDGLSLLERVEVVTLTSSSTAQSFVRWVMRGQRRTLPGRAARARGVSANLAKETLAKVMRGKTVASIGPVTTATAESLGLRVDVTARRSTIEGLVDAIETFRARRPVGATPSGSDPIFYQGGVRPRNAGRAA